MKKNDMISLSAAAQILQVSSMTVRRYVDAGTLKGLRTPLGRVVDRQSLNRLRQKRDREART